MKDELYLEEGDKFFKCYQRLIDKGVKFPSTFKAKKAVKDKAGANA